jgi:plastocyanin
MPAEGRAMRWPLPVVALAIVAAMLSGCSDSTVKGSPEPSSDAPTTPEMQDGKYVVHLGSAAFTPATLSVPVGATVLWKVDKAMHDVTEGSAGSTEHAWSSDDNGGTKLYAGQTFEHTFTEAGTISYRCVMHEQAGMVGTITVG